MDIAADMRRLIDERNKLMNMFGRGSFADGKARMRIEAIDVELARRDLCACTKCGTVEHIHLLDGKSTSGDENDDFEKLECVACYGDGWCPTSGEDDFALSVVPRLKPLYEQWAKREARRA